MENCMRAKDFIAEYELTTGVMPSRVVEDDINPADFRKRELGKVDGYRVVLYLNKHGGDNYTFITNPDETVGHITHKRPSVPGRLALSNIRKIPTASYHMDNVCHLLLNSGYTLESDNTNTESGAHKMLQRLAHSSVSSHIEDGSGNIISINTTITSPDAVDQYTIKSSDPEFLDNKKHKYILVFKNES